MNTLTATEQKVLDSLRSFKGISKIGPLIEHSGLAPKEMQKVLTSLTERDCVYPLGQGDVWTVSITNAEVLKELRQLNNPGREPTGHFTGRCKRCGSGDLWSDHIYYGCNCCGGMYFPGDTPPRMIQNGTGQDLGPAW